MIGASLAGGALVVGAAAGAETIGFALAAAAWIGSLFLRGLPRILALLAAPIAVAAALPLDTLGPQALLGIAAVFVAVAPLLHALGPFRVTPRAVATFVLPWAGVLAFLVTPPGRILGASDLALGTSVVAAAAFLLAITPLLQIRRG